jgi:hypothetical protein
MNMNRGIITSRYMILLNELKNFNPNEVSNPNELYKYWQNYISRFPELKRLLDNDRTNSGISIETITETVFIPAFSKLKNLYIARRNCLDALKEMEHKLTQFYDVEYQIVLYWGNGAGAGWYTKYNGVPSILLGFENILILDWSSKTALKALIAHEFGHLVHEHIRKDVVKKENSPTHAYDILYSEGFAQYIESLITGYNVFPELEKGNADVRSYVETNLPAICCEYKKRIHDALKVNDFFGSSCSWSGYRQLGYYLGFLFIKELSKTLSLNELASLSTENYSRYVSTFLYVYSVTFRNGDKQLPLHIQPKTFALPKT